MKLREPTVVALVIACGLLLYLPFAGSYGLWDPWETHYGEVARQMTKRGDFISLWWPGSARESATFQSKPVFSFWLMSLGMHLGGVGLPGGDAAEMALTHRAEWAMRVPFCVLGALGLAGVYLIAARFAGRRAGLLAALVTGTFPMYSLIARQAMTDMSFVGPMTLAIALAMSALWCEDDEPLPRRGRGRLTWPHVPLFYGAVALFVIVALPQLLVDSLDLRVAVPWRGRTITMYGVVVMLPYIAGFVAFLVLAARTRERAPFYLYMAAPLAGLAVLGKGLAGLGFPALILLAYVLCTRTWPRLARGQLRYGLLVALIGCAVVAVPWHHAMIVRHGWQWWNEIFGDNHWRRLMIGRHGDSGTFEYFLRELAYGTLPWVALAPAALMRAVAPAGPGAEPRRHAMMLGAIWLVCTYAVVSMSMTKFHHYILAALPGLGILMGCFLDGFLDDLLDRERTPRGAAVALVGAPFLLLVANDLLGAKNSAQRLLWLFSYDYIQSPGGRAWPAALDFRSVLGAFTIAFVVATLALLVRRFRRAGVLALGGAAVLFTVFLLDGFMPRVAPYWSQKDAVAAYYRSRRSPAERLVAYNMFWRGETFYTKNAIYEGPPEERTVFDADGNEADEPLRAWFDRHRGERHYFLFPQGREAHLRNLLPDSARPTFSLVPQPNNKFALARADL